MVAFFIRRLNEGIINGAKQQFSKRTAYPVERSTPNTITSQSYFAKYTLAKHSVFRMQCSYFLCICCLYDLGMWISCLSLLLAAILFKNALTIRFFYKIPFRLSYVVAIINILLAMIMIILCGNYYGLLLAPVCFPLVLMAVVSKKRQLQLSTLKTCMPQDEYTRIMTIEEQKKLSTTMVILLVAGFTNDVLISYCFFQGLPAIITPLYVGATAAAFTVLFFFLTVSSAVGIVFAGYAISTLKKMRKQQILKPKGLRILGYSSIVANFIPLLLFVILVGIFVIV